MMMSILLNIRVPDESTSKIHQQTHKRMASPNLERVYEALKYSDGSDYEGEVNDGNERHGLGTCVS